MKYVILFIFLFYTMPSLCQALIDKDGNKLKVEQLLALASDREARGDNKEASRYINQVATMHWEALDYQIALEYFQKSVNLNKAINNTQGIMGIYGNMAMIYADMAKYEKSLEYFEKTLAYKRKGKDKYNLSSVLINTAVILNDLKRHEEAVKYLNEALTISKELRDIEQMRSCYGMLAETYEKAGNPEKMLEYFELYRTFHEKLQRDKEEGFKKETEKARMRARLIALEKEKSELELKYQLLEKEEEVSLLDSTRRSLNQTVDKQGKEILEKDELARIKEAEANEARAIAEKEKAKRREQTTIKNFSLGFAALTLCFAVGIYVTYRMIKKANKQLTRTEKRLSEAQAIAKLGSWEYDVKHEKLELGSIARDIFGLSQTSGALPVEDYLQYLSPENRKLLSNTYQSFLHKQDTVRLEFSHHLTNKEERIIEMLIKPEANENDKALKIIRGTVRDITKEKKYLEKLEKLNESKDRILAFVAHDLRTPIHQVLGLSEILKTQLQDVPDDANETLDLIQVACNNGRNLIDELLEIGRLEDDGFKLETKELDLVTEAENNLQAFAKKFEEGKIKHTVVNKSNHDVLVSLNKQKFDRVFENLLSNAIKFTPEGGTVDVEIGQDEKAAYLQISDSGIGIPKEMQEHLFNKFSKAGRQGLKGEQSTGLGMSIVKQIVELHGGSIKVRSEEKQGTTFHITLPS